MIVFTALCCVVQAVAQEGAPPADKDQSGVLSSMSGMVDGAQKTATERFNQFVFQIDDFFGAGQEVGDVNQSWVRFRIGVLQPPDQETKLRGTVKLRLVFPRAEQRFRLLLSTEEDDSSANRPDADADARVDAEEGRDVSLALRFIRTARESGGVNFDIGLRSQDGRPLLFARLSSSYEASLGAGWTGRGSNNLYQYSRSGYEDKLTFDLRRPLFERGSVFFRTNTAFNWRKGRKGASIGETLGVYAKVSPRTALALEVLAGYNTALAAEEVERYVGTQLRLRFRQNVWRPWFYYELWPSVGWPSSNGYTRAYGALVRIEFIIGQR